MLLITCDVCKGDGWQYPLVKKDCQICCGKPIECVECGGCGWTRIIEPARCEECRGSGQTIQILTAAQSSSS